MSEIPSILHFSERRRFERAQPRRSVRNALSSELTPHYLARVPAYRSDGVTLFPSLLRTPDRSGSREDGHATIHGNQLQKRAGYRIMLYFASFCVSPRGKASARRRHRRPQGDSSGFGANFI